MYIINFFVSSLPFVTLLNILLAITIIFLERRNAATTWAWLLILFFIPVLGFILYIFFGQNLSRRRIFNLNTELTAQLRKEIKGQKELLDRNSFQFNHPTLQEYRSTIYLNLINGYGVLTQDNGVEIYTDGAAKFKALFEKIREAKDHIHMQYFIFKNDVLGKKVVQALAEKAREGVEVRLLYDAMGSSRVPGRFFKPLREAGGKVAAFFPSLFFPFINYRINYRNHRKIVVIDGEYGFVGGYNVGKEYIGLKKKFGFWRDTHLLIHGSAVESLQSRFFLDWNNASSDKLEFDLRYFPEKTYTGNIPIQIVSSGPDSEWEQIKNGIIKMIYSAEKSVYIQTPYFVPDESLMHALRIAALSGIDVRIMIPNQPDHIFVYWASFSFIGELLDIGVKCFIYENGFIHAKMLVVDGKVASVGTTNFDIRSFKLNFEVNAFIYDTNVAGQFYSIYERDLLKSREMTYEMYRNRSLIIKFKESISRLLAPIL